MTLIVLLATLSARRAVLPEDRVVRRSSLLRGGADAPAYDPLHVGVTPVTVPFAVAGETEWPSDAAPAWPDDDVTPADEEDEEVAEADYVGVTHYAEEPAMDAAAEVLADLDEVLAESPADLVAAAEPEPFVAAEPEPEPEPEAEPEPARPEAEPSPTPRWPRPPRPPPPRRRPTAPRKARRPPS